MPDGHPHQLRDSFACGLLTKGVPLEEVSKLLGHESVKTTERHYAAWVQGRQERADALVMAQNPLAQGLRSFLGQTTLTMLQETAR
jgi:integrase